MKITKTTITYKLANAGTETSKAFIEILKFSLLAMTLKGLKSLIIITYLIILPFRSSGRSAKIEKTTITKSKICQ